MVEILDHRYLLTPTGALNLAEIVSAHWKREERNADVCSSGWQRGGTFLLLVEVRVIIDIQLSV